MQLLPCTPIICFAVALMALRESEDVSLKVDKLSEAFGHSQEIVTDLLGLYGELLCSFTQASPKKCRQTLEEGGFSSEFIDNFLLKSHQLKLTSVPKLVNCKWSIDISLAEG